MEDLWVGGCIGVGRSSVVSRSESPLFKSPFHSLLWLTAVHGASLASALSPVNGVMTLSMAVKTEVLLHKAHGPAPGMQQILQKCLLFLLAWCSPRPGITELKASEGELDWSGWGGGAGLNYKGAVHSKVNWARGGMAPNWNKQTDIEQVSEGRVVGGKKHKGKNKRDRKVNKQREICLQGKNCTKIRDLEGRWGGHLRRQDALPVHPL